LDGLQRTLEASEQVGTDRMLIGLAMSDMGMVRILSQLGAEEDAIRAELGRLGGNSQQPPPGWTGARPPVVATTGPRLSWRVRPIALATPGAACLARSAFDQRRTGKLTPLEMHLLAHLALALTDHPHVDPGEDVELLARALVCTPDELAHAVDSLSAAGLVTHPYGKDEDRVAIMPQGVARAEAWLLAVVPILGRWPPDHPGVDDATG
jgi:DNA-binding MarR family transcriptional regulator